MSCNQQAVDFYFTKTGPGLYTCKCKKNRAQRDKTGYSNLKNHIVNCHPNWKEEIAMNYQPAFVATTKKAQNVFSWFQWVIFENREFSFVEKQLTRQNSNLSPISVDTLVYYIEKLVPTVETKIAQELPTKFGLIIDGWSDHSMHYVGLFACYEDHGTNSGKTKYPLLALAPLIDEENLGAESHKSFIEATLAIFNKSVENVLFLVGDNAATNKSLADLLHVPLVGCNSHRFNLGCKLYLSENEDLLEKIHVLMRKLTNLKKAGALRKKTTLRPVMRNVTRWSSTHDMVARYLQLKPYIDLEDPELAQLSLSPGENLRVEILLTNLQKLNSVTKRLQSVDLDLYDCRILFDAVIQEFPVFAKYLSNNASIIHSPKFETTIVTILQNQTLPLEIPMISRRPRHHLLTRYWRKSRDRPHSANSIE
jgi:hypothetical protein